MEDAPKFIIKGTSDPEIKEKLISVIKKEHEAGFEMWKGESKKTAEHLKRIGALNLAISEVMAELGLQFQEIEAGQIHFLYDFSNYENIDKNEEGYACHSGEFLPLKKSIIVDELSTEQLIEGAEQKVRDGFENLVDELSYASSDAFAEQFPDEKEDLDNPKHQKWSDQYIDKRMPDEERIVKLSQKLAVCHILLHEMLHASSHLPYTNLLPVIPDRESNPEIEVDLGYARSGYHDTINHFFALNEAVTEKLTCEILRSKRQLIVRDKSGDFEKLEKLIEEGSESAGEIMPGIISPTSYGSFIDVLNVIIKQIASREGREEQEVWTKIKRGYFTGEMMHLRDIERVFGKGSLRLFANTDKSNVNLVMEYFSTTDTSKKDELAKQILEDRPIEAAQWRRRVEGIKVEE